jgi:uncharacterized protein (TIGR01777 family)
MKIFMTGATGFVGTALTRRLIDAGHTVTILTQTQPDPSSAGSDRSYLIGDPSAGGSWQDAVAAHDVVINLAGASIFSRWTEKYKKVLRSSRLDTTRRLFEALPEDAGHITFFSTSAVGYYGFHEDEELTESSPAGADFLAQLAYDWEHEALRAQSKGARVIVTRFGIVLGPNGGALGQMVLLFKNFLGGPLGSGRQWFSWIHMQDLADAFLFLLARPDLSGPFNVCSPMPVRNSDLASALGRVLHRPAFLPAPAFMVELLLGEFGSVLLKGQRVVPRRLLDAGFRFQHPEIQEALRNILL